MHFYTISLIYSLFNYTRLILNLTILNLYILFKFNTSNYHNLFTTDSSEIN